MNSVEYLWKMDDILAFGIKAIGLQIFSTMAAGKIASFVSPNDSVKIFQLQILTALVFTFLTIYTISSMRDGVNFEFYGPLLVASLIAYVGFGLIQVLFPLGKIGKMIYGGVGLSIYPYVIVYATSNLIQRHAAVY